MKKFILLTFLLGSICAQNINMDFGESLEQGWIKRDSESDPQGLSEVTKVNLFGYECIGSVKSAFIRWKWGFSGFFLCPKLTSIVGYSTNFKSKKDALEKALSDFMFKSIQTNVINIKKLKTSSNHARLLKTKWPI